MLTDPILLLKLIQLPHFSESFHFLVGGELDGVVDGYAPGLLGAQLQPPLHVVVDVELRIWRGGSLLRPADHGLD